MTLEDFLTLPLTGRIEALRRQAGSHDKLAAILNTSRQTVIGWEKGVQPNERHRESLAAFSGFPESAFLRSEESQELQTLVERVGYLEDLLGVAKDDDAMARGEDRARSVLVEIIEALNQQRVEEAKRIALEALQWFDEYHAPPSQRPNSLGSP